MYKLEVTGRAILADAGFLNTPVWGNFCDHLRILARERSIDIRNILDDELGKFNAINEFGTGFLIFESEEDATVFVLRWS